MPQPQTNTPQPTQAPLPYEQVPVDSFTLDTGFDDWYRRGMVPDAQGAMQPVHAAFPNVASAREYYDIRNHLKAAPKPEAPAPEPGKPIDAPAGGTSGGYNPEFETWWKQHGGMKFGTDKELGRRWWELRKAGSAGAGVAELGKLLTQSRNV